MPRWKSLLGDGWLSMKKFFLPKDLASLKHVQDESSEVSSGSSAATVEYGDSTKTSEAFQSWIKMKGHDESQRLNVIASRRAEEIVCLICWRHALAWNRSRKSAYICAVIPARPQRPSRFDNHLRSDQSKHACGIRQTEMLHSFSNTYGDSLARAGNLVSGQT